MIPKPYIPERKGRRKTLLWQIKKLVAEGRTEQAEIVAQWGRELSKLEDTFFVHYVNLFLIKEFPKWKPVNWQGRWMNLALEKRAGLLRKTERNYRRQAKVISDIFIDAVNRHDKQKIVEIANAVEFFKEKLPPIYSAQDSESRKILSLKQALETGGEMTIREVAEYLANGKKIKTPADGFSALRRKCHALSFPLTNSRKTKKK